MEMVQGCLDVLDGTHVNVKARLATKGCYRNRKGEITVNVLGVCNKDMNFTYLLTGWKGSATDCRILRDAVTRENGLRVPMSGTVTQKKSSSKRKKSIDSVDEMMVDVVGQ